MGRTAVRRGPCVRKRMDLDYTHQLRLHAGSHFVGQGGAWGSSL